MACQCCNGSKDQSDKDKQLDAVFEKYRGMNGALIPVLQAAQDVYGYLPKEAMERIARELKLPFSKVFGVATFYSQFHLDPRGENIIRVCLGTACHVRGGAGIFGKVKEVLGVEDGETTEDLKFTLESVACIGACGLAPVMMVNDDTHGRLTPDKIPEIIDKYK
ncbi:NADH-quinone oxidoreductase subunit NuoE [Metallumcola ferriviriculae]|uniref:NADH-quinone oxidoreductase subunit NuoE n=1 Tax=Metallumcola ferriviriculae TaxID=3039180 RepID=A0AAU0UTA3_9FIRM|nr:NADH-quinone oxidoreductase subunit NuoE [Desulfitibacteraceae bacterium MK1]